MPICKKCSKPYFHETNYENLCCKCYDKQNEKIYHCYPELPKDNSSELILILYKIHDALKLASNKRCD